MTARARKNKKSARSLEATLWAAADKLRGHMDAAEYKHVVLGLIFLKYISDAFKEHQNKLKEENSFRYVKSGFYGSHQLERPV